jgi:hypothetical protein
MTNKDFKEGMEVSFSCGGETHTDWILHYSDNGEWYAYPDNNFQGWTTRINVDNIDNLQPKHRTIDDLECGDYVVDECGWKRKCLGRCGEIYAVSNYWKDDENDSDKIHCEWYSGYQLKKAGWTLYQPTEEKEEEKETDIDRCIKVVEEYFEDNCSLTNRALIEKLKNLKK